MGGALAENLVLCGEPSGSFGRKGQGEPSKISPNSYSFDCTYKLLPCSGENSHHTLSDYGLQIPYVHIIHFTKILNLLQRMLEEKENMPFKLAKTMKDSKAVKITLVEPCSQCR